MSQHHAAFRDELVRAGVLLLTGVDGLYGKSSGFESVVDAISAMARRSAADLRPREVRFPPVLSRAAFEQTDYLRAFPDLIGSIHGFRGGDREHAELLAVVEQGGDWTKALTPTEVVLSPAACYPLYPMATGALPEGGAHLAIVNWCFRHEPSIDPCRLLAFRMHEVVCMAEPDRAEVFRDRWVEQGLELMGGLGLRVEAVVANDPFFGRAGRMLAVNQRDEALKYEIVCAVSDDEHPTAIMSSNCHRDHFALPFAIRTASGGPAHTACVGFGLERITLALLRTHGVDIDGWPHPVRAALWP